MSKENKDQIKDDEKVITDSELKSKDGSITIKATNFLDETRKSNILAKSFDDLHKEVTEARDQLVQLQRACSTKDNDNPNATMSWEQGAEDLGTNVGSLKARASNLNSFVEFGQKHLIALSEAEKINRNANMVLPDANTNYDGAIVKRDPFADDPTIIDFLEKSKDADKLEDVIKDNGGKLKLAVSNYPNVRMSQILNASIKTHTGDGAAIGISVNRPRSDDLVYTKERMHNIVHRIPTVQVMDGGDSFYYPVEASGNRNEAGTFFADTAEDAAYPQKTIQTSNSIVTVRKRAVYMTVTDEQLDDVSFAKQWITTRLSRNYANDLEFMGLQGDGSDDVTGLLNMSGIQTKSAPAYDSTPDPDVLTKFTFDHISDCIKDLEVTGYTTASFLGLRNEDLNNLRKARDKEGNYVWGQITSGQPSTVWGIPIVVSQFLPSNTMILIDINDFFCVEKKGIAVQWGYTGDDFIHGRQSIKASYRLNFGSYYPNSLVKITNSDRLQWNRSASNQE